MIRKTVWLGLALAGCAAGPRPMPQTSTPTERLAQMEDVLLHANNLAAKFEIESKGENPSTFTGTLRFYSGNALFLQADGRFKEDVATIQVDSRDATSINRTISRGPSASSHKDPPATHLREAVALGLSRMGLLHNLARLTQDASIDHLEGGFGEAVKAVAPSDGASDTIHGEACHRVNFAIAFDGKTVGDASVCVSDTSSLPIGRTQTMHFPTGEMTVTETFTWEQK